MALSDYRSSKNRCISMIREPRALPDEGPGQKSSDSWRCDEREGHSGEHVSHSGRRHWPSPGDTPEGPEIQTRNGTRRITYRWKDIPETEATEAVGFANEIARRRIELFPIDSTLAALADTLVDLAARANARLNEGDYFYRSQPRGSE